MSYILGIGELFCKLENLLNVHGNALKVVKRNGNEDQSIGYLANSLAEKIASLMRQGFLKTIKDEITGKRIAATEGIWMQGGSFTNTL